MITLASIGDLPALPLGMSYPKRKNWLLGKPNKSKRLKFTPFKKESMNFHVIPNITEFFEAVDPKQRDMRINRLKSAYHKVDRLGGMHNATTAQRDKYRASRGKLDKIAGIINKHKIPGGVRGKDIAKVTFKDTDKFRNRSTKQGTAGHMQGYMHNPGATMHVAKKLASGKTKWYKGTSFPHGNPQVFSRKSD